MQPGRGPNGLTARAQGRSASVQMVVRPCPDGHDTDHLFDPHGASYTPRPVAARRPAPTAAPAVTDPLAAFSPAVRDWFSASFAEPTAAQAGGWAAIAAGRHTLIHAPTGSGKTLAAFLW